MTINVYLHRDRSIPGVLVVAPNDITDPLDYPAFACLGRSDKAAGEKHENPTLDPLKPYGHLPTGEYLGTVTAGGVSAKSFGPHKRILLAPVSGQCKEAVGRWGLMIHGGARKPNGDFRPTHGCLRVTDETMAELIRLIGTETVRVRVVEV